MLFYICIVSGMVDNYSGASSLNLNQFTVIDLISEHTLISGHPPFLFNE